MAFKKEKDTYTFSVKGKELEVFLTDESVEIYETENPGKTGFFFRGAKELTLFCNLLSDIIEDFQGRKNV
jgi:hypothetical protein